MSIEEGGLLRTIREAQRREKKRNTELEAQLKEARDKITLLESSIPSRQGDEAAELQGYRTHSDLTSVLSQLNVPYPSERASMILATASDEADIDRDFLQVWFEENALPAGDLQREYGPHNGPADA